MRRKILAVAAGVFMGLAATVAYAQWLGNADGTAQGSTALPTVTLTAAAPSGTALYPGATGDLGADIVNSGGSAVTITGVDFFPGDPNGVIFTPASNTATCAPHIGMSHAVLNISVPAGSSHKLLPGTVTLDSTAPASCNNLTFSVHVRATFSTA